MVNEQWFFSGSKDDESKYLSNFTSHDRGAKYPSIESQFQAMKFCYSDNPQHRLTIDWANASPKDCRSFGSKTYFRKHHIQLNVSKWEKDKVPIMWELLKIRYKKDPCFRNILKKSKKNNVRLMHYSLRDKFWGAYRKKATNELIGKNMLGKLMSQLTK